MDRRLTLRVPSELVAQLAELARAERKTTGAVMRDALTAHVDRRANRATT